MLKYLISPFLKKISGWCYQSVHFLLECSGTEGKDESEDHRAISVSELLRQPNHHETMSTLIPNKMCNINYFT